jgi:hypothetical protein
VNVVRTFIDLHAFDHATHEELRARAVDRQADGLDPPREIRRRRRAGQRRVHERRHRKVLELQIDQVDREVVGSAVVVADERVNILRVIIVCERDEEIRIELIGME